MMCMQGWSQDFISGGGLSRSQLLLLLFIQAFCPNWNRSAVLLRVLMSTPTDINKELATGSVLYMYNIRAVLYMEVFGVFGVII